MKPQKIAYWGIILGTLLCIAAIQIQSQLKTVMAADTKNILVIDGTDPANAKFLSERLALDSRFDVTLSNLTLNRLDSWNEYDIIVLNDVVLTSNEIIQLQASLNAGKTVFFNFGPNSTANPSALQTLGLVNTAGVATNPEKKIITTENVNITYDNKIKWSSCPEINNYTILDLASGGNAALTYPPQIIINSEQIPEESKRTQVDPLILKYEVGTGQFYLVNIWLDTASRNVNFQLWPIYNYVWYVMLSDAADLTIETYGSWQQSPVPHVAEQTLLGVLVIVCVVIVTYFFKRMQKKSAEKISEEELQKLAAEEKKKADLNDPWEQIGPHRQISGFLFSLFMSLLLVLPQLIVTIMIMPQFIQPYPQVGGWFSWVKNFAQAIWLLFDVGTSFGMIKYFAQYRVKQPEKAVHYIQIFVWWQMISGTVQIAIFSFGASLILPASDIAHLSWVFILHSLIQYPGWFLVFMYIFQAMQRTDNYAITQILYLVFFPVIGQVLFILIFRAWGASNPIFGEAMGAAIGYGIGMYAAEWMTFAFGVYMFRKLGFHTKTIFRVDFSTSELKETLSYGIRLTVGSVAPPLVWMLQMFLIQKWILNWSAEQGYYELISTFMMVVNLVSLFFNGTIGAYSEAYEHGKHKLVQLYISEGFHWGNYFLFFLIALLYSVGDKIILGAAGPTWARAIVFIGPYLIFQLLGPISWLGDSVFEGCGRTDLAAKAWLLEQSLRAIFLLICLSPDLLNMGMIGVLWAYIPALAIKNTYVLIAIYKKISKYNVYAFQNIVAPLLAGIVIYAFMKWFGDFIWTTSLQGMIGAGLLFIIGIFGVMYLFAFFVGLFGGWDDNLLNEFRRSVAMIKSIQIFPKLLLKMTELGCKISPLHNKFPMTIWKEGMEEADALTKEKVKLEM